MPLPAVYRFSLAMSAPGVFLRSGPLGLDALMVHTF